MTKRISYSPRRTRILRAVRALGGVAMAALLAAPAQAALVQLTWDGMTVAGSDKIGLFGAPTSNFQSTAYRVTYVFDTQVSYTANTTNGSQDVTGGTFFNTFRPSPLVSASILVNGVTLAIGGSYYGQYFSQSGQGSSGIQAEADPDPALDQGSYPSPYTANLFQRVFRLGNFYGLPFDQPATYAFTAADNPGGNFGFAYRDAQGNILNNTGFGLTPTQLVISTPGGGGGGAVPEPATWGMMILGFGLAGSMLRYAGTGRRARRLSAG